MSQPGPTIPARAIIVSFVAMMLAASVFAWFVVRHVRQDAVVADRAVRVAGWSILAYADHEGRFPTDQAMLESAFSEQAATGAAPVPAWWTQVAPAPAGAPRAWPVRLVDAGIDGPPLEGGRDLPRELRAALRGIAVQFASDPAQPPRVGAGGRPTKLGTLSEVNGWLEAWTLERSRASQPVAPGSTG